MPRIAPTAANNAMNARSIFCADVSGGFVGEEGACVGCSDGFSSTPADDRWPRRSSSAVTPNTSAYSVRIEISGLPAPDSHFEIVLLDKLSWSANCCCVKPFSFRSSAISFPVRALSIAVTCSPKSFASKVYHIRRPFSMMKGRKESM